MLTRLGSNGLRVSVPAANKSTILTRVNRIGKAGGEVRFRFFEKKISLQVNRTHQQNKNTGGVFPNKISELPRAGYF